MLGGVRVGWDLGSGGWVASGKRGVVSHWFIGVGAESPGTAGSDYEIWVPEFAGECILGERDAYVRRNRTAKCYNNLQYETRTVVERCPCRIEDYIWYAACDGLRALATP